MGCFGKSAPGADDPEAKRIDKEIQKQLKMDKRTFESEVKLLLLGAGESGKSTIFKQMKIIHQNGYGKEECVRLREVIYGNILQSIRTLVEAVEAFGYSYDNNDNRAAAHTIASIPETQLIVEAASVLTPALGKQIKTLYRDTAIQQAFDRRAEYQLHDSTSYYMTNLDRIATSDYVPNQQDVLRSRVKTVGVVETEFLVEGNKFKMVDVGGQRNERRKWIHCFDDVTAILFITALSEYDQKLVEDESVNRMKESLVLFEEICNCRYFKTTPIIIFFNKKDLFEDKIKKVDLNVCFKEYQGGKNYQPALEYIMQQFVAKNKSDRRQLFMHVTCATDTENMRVVFEAVKSIVLNDNLERNNLL